MIIVDTTVWINSIGGRETSHAAWLDAAIPVMRLGLTDLILCELLQGVRGEAQARRLALEMARFEIFATAGTELAVCEGMDTVDASELDPSPLGHSYLVRSRAVIADVADVICRRLPPEQRNLTRLSSNGLAYWKLTEPKQVKNGQR